MTAPTRSAVGRASNATRFGNWLSGRLIGVCWGRRRPDLSPRKAVRREALEALALREQGHGCTVELLASAVSASLVIEEVTVGERRRAGVAPGRECRGATAGAA